MSLLQKLREGVEKATGEVGELAQNARTKLEVARLNDDRNQLLREIGQQICARHAQGRPVPEVEDLCERVVALEAQIREKEAQAGSAGAEEAV
jgi:hypothetical protein